MDYYQNVVIDYLRANRSTFVNTEYCIQLNPMANPDQSGPHWYCDALALDLNSQTAFLCEVSYARHLNDLTKRIKSWHESWELLLAALGRDSSMGKIGLGWPVRPWLFVPEERVKLLLRRFDQIAEGKPLRFAPRITPLEMVQPWQYCSWNRDGEKQKTSAIPDGMQI